MTPSRWGNGGSETIAVVQPKQSRNQLVLPAVMLD
jgi:hypothetical protein